MIILTQDKTTLTEYLLDRGWLSDDEQLLRVAVPGNGNMNFTLRLEAENKSCIIKQSRGYVEKYPQVAAPESRVLREAEFYGLVQAVPELARMVPSVIDLDQDHNIMLMDDLGVSRDYAFIYQDARHIQETVLLTVMEFAARLHSGITLETSSTLIQNLDMRVLNHEHIFIYPLMMDNGLDLDSVLPGLQAASEPLKRDERLKQKVSRLGEVYLADGVSLLHGDYFPGSWLLTDDGVKVIDPEFCFFGPPEFDIGVAVAHLLMADQSEELIRKALDHYVSIAPLDESLRQSFTAIEVIRRILGLAQLPLDIPLEKRVALLEWARGVLRQ